MLILVAGVTAAGAAAGFLIAGSVTASLRRLTAAAEAVESTGQLDVDVPAGGNDEVGRLGAAFRRMLDALARSKADQQRLVQDAGHELRTPLTSLRTNLDVLLRYPDLPPDQRRQVVDDLHAETEELVAARRGGRRRRQRWARRRPVRTVSRSVTSPGSWRRATHVAAAGRCGSRPTSRRSRVSSAPSNGRLSNLLDNARKFDPSGGVIDVRVSNGTVEVLDRGPGIVDGEQALVFERFHRSTEARTLPGSGLGLSIVRDVVERHHGTVRVASRDGGGAVRRVHPAPPTGPVLARLIRPGTPRGPDFRQSDFVHRRRCANSDCPRNGPGRSILTVLLRRSRRPHTGRSHDGPQAPSGRTDTSHTTRESST